MNVELNDELDRRAAKHAALSDPTRIRIVDMLTLGDFAPSELQTALDMPSNLLAHHLGVLERAALVARGRSEADRRRTYVHLVPDALEGLLPGRAQPASRVVFVCTANSARSHLAAELWATASTVPSASAGTHPAESIDSGAVAVAHRRGLNLPSARPRGLQEVLADGDLVITVCDNAHEELGARSRLHWSVPDPVRIGTDAAFDAAFDDIARRIGDLAPRIVAS